MRRLLPLRLGREQEAELADHLGELRHRLLVCLVALVPAFALAFAVHERIVGLLAAPLPDDRKLITLGVTEPFTTSVKVSLLTAAALVLPVLLWQTWSFLAPAVSPRFQRTLGAFVALATALFAAGIAFGYVVLLPRALDFLTSFDSELYDIQIRASYYYGFVALTLFALGLAFQLPITILALTRLEVLSAATLRRNRRVAYAILVACAVLLPTVDPVSLALETVPLLALFELSVVLAAVLEPRWRTALATERL